MANLVENPLPIFTDANGDPLEDGYIFIGEPGLSPINSPLQAYWDSDLSIPANNIRTKGGYPSNSGTPGRLYTATNYSILVQDVRGATLYTNLDSVDYFNSASGSLISEVDTIADLRGLALAAAGAQASVGGSVTVGDGLMGPLYYWDATSPAIDNGVSIIKPTATVGNGRWLWINTNAPMENVNISSSSTLVLDFKNRIFLVDTALAIVSAVPDGDFQGQNIQIANRGVSTLQITGTGILANTFITEEAELTWLGTQWSIGVRSSDLTSISTAVRGYAAVSLSNYATDSFPEVKSGSVFENNGVVVTIGADLTPTGYAGMTVSTVFYLYYQESTGTFIYLNTVPTWSDALQGHYNGNDRALFSLFKDSGGTLYEDKRIITHLSEQQLDSLLVSDITMSNKIKFKYYYKSDASPTEDELLTELLTWLTVDGQYMSFTNGQAINGQVTTIGALVTGAWRQSSTVITIGLTQSNGTGAQVQLNSGDATVVATSIEFMSNSDPIN